MLRTFFVMTALAATLALGIFTAFAADDSPTVQKIPGVDFSKPGPLPSPSPSSSPLQSFKRGKRERQGALPVGIGASGNNYGTNGVGKVKIGF